MNELLRLVEGFCVLMEQKPKENKLAACKLYLNLILNNI